MAVFVSAINDQIPHIYKGYRSGADFLVHILVHISAVLLDQEGSIVPHPL